MTAAQLQIDETEQERVERWRSEALERAFLHACGWAQLIRAGVRTQHPSDSPLLETLRWSGVPILPGDPDRRAATPACTSDFTR